MKKILFCLLLLIFPTFVFAISGTTLKKGMVFKNGEYIYIENMPDPFYIGSDINDLRYQYYVTAYFYDLDGNVYDYYSFYNEGYFYFPSYYDSSSGSYSDVTWELVEYGYTDETTGKTQCYRYNDSDSSDYIYFYDRSDADSYLRYYFSFSSNERSDILSKKYDCNITYGSNFKVVFKPVKKDGKSTDIYTSPKIELDCDNKDLKAGDKTACNLCLNNKYTVTELAFDLSSDKLEISNIVSDPEWQVTENDGKTIKFKLKLGNSLYPNLDSTKCTNDIADFDALSNSTLIEKVTAVVTASNFNYTDDIKSDTIDEVDVKLNVDASENTTKVTTTKKVEETDENPPTGLIDLTILIPIVLLLGYFGYNYMYKKNFFKKI